MAFSPFPPFLQDSNLRHNAAGAGTRPGRGCLGSMPYRSQFAHVGEHGSYRRAFLGRLLSSFRPPCRSVSRPKNRHRPIIESESR
jgi:hypothetical protein